MLYVDKVSRKDLPSAKQFSRTNFSIEKMCKIVESTATCTLKETNISKISYSTDIPGNRAFSFYFFPYLG